MKLLHFKHKTHYQVVFGFNVQVDLDAQIEADKRGVKIFNESNLPLN